ncbi:MAG: metallophosphoesterase family protein [Bryobacteraceae bacterium]|nr:metallophosphoesterase family protein [Bryobacteraceae bacterium]
MRLGSSRLPLAAGFVALGFAAHLSISWSDAAKIPGETLHRPSALPDRIILTWAGDPATSQAVTWRTGASVKRPVAQIAPAEDGPDFVKRADEVPVVSEPFLSDINEGIYHTARFEGLKPDTLYVYRVGDRANWSEWNQFRTAADQPAPLTFLYVGDAQNDIYEHWSRVIRMGFSEAPKASFILHAGDLVNRGNRDAELGEWHQAAGWINRWVTSLPVAGNHEYGTWQEGRRALTAHWRPQFALPENGPQGLEESCYWIDIQGVRFVILNSNELVEEQAAWLEAVLAANPNRWTILAFHHPIFSSARGRDNRVLRETWKPVFDRHSVDLVLQGHDHTYARSNLLSGVNAADPEGGAVYVVSVSGPKQYRVQRETWMARAAERTQLFQVVRVDGDVLSYEARTATGALYDAFELRKVQGRPNELISKVPDVPERLGATD